MNFQKEKMRFLRDTTTHQLTIARDDGVYRHLVFKQPGSSSYRFDLITWPGYLCYTGDMGTYVFTRVYDMLEFFRKNSFDASIDHRYWAEKVEGADKGDGVFRFNHAAFRREVRECVRSFTHTMLQDMRDESDEDKRIAIAAARELRAAVASAVLNSDDNEVRAFDAANNFSFHSEQYDYDCENWRLHWRGSPRANAFTFSDFWERDCKEYTLRFVWCCYALVWGILRYDEVKAAQAAEAVEVCA